MANDQKLNITVVVNAETGQLEVLGAKMKQAGEQSENAFKKFMPAVTAAGILAFLKSAVDGAEESNQTMERLKFTLESNGQSWKANSQKIDEWSKAISSATRFSDGEALQSLDKLTRATGNVSQAQKASELAMGLSVKTGKSLGETTDFVSNLINKNSRAVMEAHREYGTFVGSARTAQQVLDELSANFKNAALNQDTLTDKTKSLENSFGKFKDAIGNLIIPSLKKVIDSGSGVITFFEKAALVLVSFYTKAAAVYMDFSAATIKAFKFDFSGAKQSLLSMFTDVKAINEDLYKQLDGLETKKTVNDIKHANERIQVSSHVSEEELAEKQKLLELETELQQKIDSLGDQTYKKKTDSLNSEIAARRGKINTELKLETDKEKALQKLNEYEKVAAANLAKDNIHIKQQQAFETANVAIQTLQTLNSLGESGSHAERVRAQALLALQSSISIGWIWVAAAKSAGETGIFGAPAIFALATAQTALTLAQFAQQSRNIDRAASQESAGISGISLNAPAPGIDLGGGGSGGIAIGGGGGSSISSSGGGSGGGGQTIINVGGIVVNFDVDKLSTDNADAVLRALYQKLRQGTVEGIQFALQSKAIADKNSNLAS